MRRRLIACCAVAAGCSFGGDRKPARPGAIFRYTVDGRSAPWDSIILGQPSKSEEKSGESEGDTLTELHYGNFGGADTNVDHRDSNGIVT